MLELRKDLVDRIRKERGVLEETAIEILDNEIALVDTGECYCYKCEKYFDLYDEQEVDIFYDNHEWFATIDMCEYYFCKA